VTLEIHITEGEHGVMVRPEVAGDREATVAEADALDAVVRAIHAAFTARGAVHVARDECPGPECGARIRRPTVT
jgi:hypothetical protein